MLEGVFVMAATSSSVQVYRVTRGLTEENFYLVDKYGGQGQNRTADTGIFRASKINNLLIMLKQGFFGTVGDSYVDSVC
jgi:hypothetical protein